jgi:hypothetical protein
MVTFRYGWRWSSDQGQKGSFLFLTGSGNWREPTETAFPQL